MQSESLEHGIYKGFSTRYLSYSSNWPSLDFAYGLLLIRVCVVQTVLTLFLRIQRSCRSDL
jgi:hypothetical protein